MSRHWILFIIVILTTSQVSAQDKYRGEDITPEQFAILYQDGAATLRVYDNRIFVSESDGNFPPMLPDTLIGNIGMVRGVIDATEGNYATIKMIFDKKFNEESLEGVIINNSKLRPGHSVNDVLMRVNAPKGKLPFRSTHYFALTSPPTEDQLRKFINDGGILYRTEEKISYDGACKECRGDRYITEVNPATRKRTRKHCRRCLGSGHGAQVKIKERVPIPIFESTISEQEAEARFTKTFHGEVVGVLDGATLMLAIDGGSMNMCLYGVKAPALNANYGKASRRALTRLVGGQKVNISYFSENDKNYGNIFLNQRYINEEMLREGHAWYDGKQPSTKLKQAETAAQEEKKGWWMFNQ